jgi:hypothetical protein
VIANWMNSRSVRRVHLIWEKAQGLGLVESQVSWKPHGQG